jgi:5'-methylthioadenosine phosphorylase
VFGENTERLRGVLLDAVQALPEERPCGCDAALDGIDVPDQQPG